MGNYIGAGRWQRSVVTAVAVVALLVPALGVDATVSDAATPDDWPMYLLNDAHTGFNANETAINRTSAGSLRPLWRVQAGGAVSAQPVVSNGLVYSGTWDGYERARDPMTGQVVWQTFLGQTTGCGFGSSTSTTGVASTPAVVPNITVAGATRPSVLFLGGGNSQMVALDASSGAPLWQTQLGQPPNSFVWSSPAYYNGSIYIGLSSFNDCPLVQGQLLQLDAHTGAIQHVFNVVPNGCVGGSVTSAPAVDGATGRVYIATGNPDPSCPAGPNYGYSVLELSASDLSLLGAWTLSNPPTDSDFLSSVTLFTVPVGNGHSKHTRQMLGVPNKNGQYYVLERGKLDKGPAWSKTWSTTLAIPGEGPEYGEGSIAPSAWDGTSLYVGGGRTTINGVSCQGSLQALDPSNGATRWQVCLNGAVLGAITAVPGVVAVGTYSFGGGQFLSLVDATNGSILGRYSSPGMDFYGAASVANGVLYIGDVSGNLFAFGP